MATDQHFCLRWNNHQSTLISVFDTLLESGTLVDCTLAADGQQLKAHKVVLSACSPYLEALLSQHYDKHPIIILRDVKFPELKAMLDYMYRGEVNITQEQLGTFLKAAESLQIKGLTDSGGGGGMGGESKRHDIRKQLTMPPAAVTPQTRPRTSGLGGGNGGEIAARKSAAGTHIPAHIMDVAPSSPLKAREGSVSPVVKKRRKPDHPQHNDDARLVQTSLATDNGGSPSSDPSDEPLINNTPNNNNSWPPKIDNNKVVDNNTNSTNNNNNSSSKDKTAAAALAAVKCEQSAEDLLQPKAEYIDADDTNDNENSADDDDDDDDGANKMDASKPGPSHSANTQGYQSWMEDDSSNEESGASNNQQNSQGYGQWHVSTDGSADETMMTAPPQDSQGGGGPVRKYLNQMQVANWDSWSAAHPSVSNLLQRALSTYSPPSAAEQTSSTSPTAFKGVECPKCGRHYKLKSSLRNHQKWECGKEPQFQCPYCNYRAKQKMHVARHIERMHREKLDMLDINDKTVAAAIKDEKPFTTT